MIDFYSYSWRRYTLVLLSVLLAMVLWVYVTNVQFPMQEQEFRVSLEKSGLSEGFMVKNLPDRISVRVRAGDIKVDGLTAADFKASVDLTGVKLGDNTLPVRVSAPPGVEITQIVPNQITLNVDKLVQKQLPVAVMLQGTPQNGYKTEAPQVYPNLVLVRGPSKVLADIKNIPVKVDVSGAQKSLEYSLPISITEEGVRVSPEVVKVTVPVKINVPHKTVPITVITNGQVGDGYEIDNLIAATAFVEVYATPEILATIGEIKTNPVNLNNTTENLKALTDLILPNGAILLQPSQVEVAVQVRAKPKDKPAPPEPVTPPDKTPTNSE